MIRRMLSCLGGCVFKMPSSRPESGVGTADTTAVDRAISHYEQKYRLVDCNHALVAAQKQKIGDRNHRVCRFCGKSSPQVTFKQTTHALPESIGNKSITTFYECDTCNQKFGAGIDTEFGKWS